MVWSLPEVRWAAAATVLFGVGLLVHVPECARDGGRATRVDRHRGRAADRGHPAATAAAVAAEVGIDDVRAALLPQDKVEAVRALQRDRIGPVIANRPARLWSV